jgi:phosphoenolpyruvate carboxykinase (diphosphate)
VKTQISYAANLYGLAEEEHSGGAVAYPSYILGREFHASEAVAQNTRTFNDAVRLMDDTAEVKAEGYAVDRQYPTILYVPEDSWFNVKDRSVSWTKNNAKQKIKLLADHVYVLPSGYKVRMERQIGGRVWRLVGTTAEGTFCHKPSTVSGGGKSEISKSIVNSMLQGPVFIKDFHKDFDQVEEILKKDFTNISRNPKDRETRAILSPERSLGSVIKLFTPSPDFTDEHNNWLVALPQTLRQLIFVLKRYYKPEWGNEWRQHFSVDRINGYLGHELKYDEQHLIANYLRVGLDKDGSWRIYKMRTDFNPADKVQVEDDITASVVVPRDALNDLNPSTENPSVKIVKNCEAMLFQRPDDAIHRGYDKQAEIDIATPNTFLSNFQPLTRKIVQDIIEDVIDYELYSQPVKKMLMDFSLESSPDFVVSSSHPRIVDGKPSKNPRYLQNRPDIVDSRGTYLANVGKRLSRGIPAHQPIQFSVDAVLAGRRNNPPDRENGIPPLAVYNPIHYQELPELFMDFVSSLTGKSPSTTGFGSEGPFNALWPVVDLNNALVSYILTGYPGFTTSAGNIGPNIRVDHDISLLVPEIWCRLKGPERDPSYLIQNGYLEKLEDFELNGRKIKASLLGYRITQRFVDRIMGRIFELPNAVFTEEILQPEKQDVTLFAEGIENIVATYERVAQNYVNDGSIEAACPPLKALLSIMATGTYEGKGINHPDIRGLFTRETLLKSDWYEERLKTKQVRDVALWQRFVKTIEDFRNRAGNASADGELKLSERLELAKKNLQEAQSSDYLKRLRGTLGADPFHRQIPQEGKEKAVLASVR